MENNYSKSNNPRMSEDIRLFAQAFAISKRSFRATGKSARNDHQKYNYAKIEDIYNAVEDALLDNNIVIWHGSDLIESNEVMRTRLTHTLSGQFIEDIRLLVSEKPGNQAKGAANTYMKKYALLSLCAIPTEDDDGAEEEEYISNEDKLPITEDQEKTLSRCRPEYQESIFKRYNVTHLGQLKRGQFKEITSTWKK